MWWLEKINKIGAVEEDDSPYKNPPLSAPRNEHEVKLLEKLLYRHHDYIKEKAQEAQNIIQWQYKISGFIIKIWIHQKDCTN
jgi:hypothetical protein